MKKIVTLLAVCLFLLSAGCSTQQESAEKTTASKTTTEEIKPQIPDIVDKTYRYYRIAIQKKCVFILVGRYFRRQRCEILFFRTQRFCKHRNKSFLLC